MPDYLRKYPYEDCKCHGSPGYTHYNGDGCTCDAHGYLWPGPAPYAEPDNEETAYRGSVSHSVQPAAANVECPTCTNRECGFCLAYVRREGARTVFYIAAGVTHRHAFQPDEDGRRWLIVGSVGGASGSDGGAPLRGKKVGE